MTTILITFLASFLLILLVIVGMSVGVLNGRRAIKGSCGGLNGGGCELCSGNCSKRETEEN
ncbi:MAG: hypothetical protein OEM00_00400 [Burkholderiaceae bacterium]|nr:hypothetical protein [Burkholderiaceae bacterium]